MKKRTWIFAVMLIAALLSAATAQTVDDATRKAVAKYPDLVRDGSPLHEEFLKLYHEAQEFNPTLLSDPDWPIILSDSASALVTVNPAPSASPATDPSPAASASPAPSAPRMPAAASPSQVGKSDQSESSSASIVEAVQDSLTVKIWTLVIETFTAIGIVALAMVAIWRDQMIDLLNPTKGEIQSFNLDGKEEGAPQMPIQTYHVKAVATRRRLKGCMIVFRQVNRIMVDGVLKPSIYPLWRQLQWAPAERTEAKVTITTEQEANLGKYDRKTDRFEIEFYPQSGDFDPFVNRGQCAKLLLHLRAENFQDDIPTVVTIDMTGPAGEKPTVAVG
jgi:hypothetical protein